MPGSGTSRTRGRRSGRTCPAGSGWRWMRSAPSNSAPRRCSWFHGSDRPSMAWCPPSFPPGSSSSCPSGWWRVWSTCRPSGTMNTPSPRTGWSGSGSTGSAGSLSGIGFAYAFAGLTPTGGRWISYWLKSSRKTNRMKGNPGVPMPKKLLLAEDSLTIQKVFELAFAHSDVSITAVDNGEDAVRLAGEIVPDLVVADVTLPGKDGYAVAAELRAAEKTRGIPVLILSGSLAPLDEQRFRTSRASGVLFKPFDSQELMGKVEGLLRREAEAPPAAGVVPEGQPP